MNIGELFKKSLNILIKNEIKNEIVKGISMDSRQVNSGDVFVAIPCLDVNFHIEEAIKKGASFIVQEWNDSPLKGDYTIFVEDTRLAAAQLCQNFYRPIPELLMAVTGTNGKSSTVIMVSQILCKLGILSSSIGTLGVHIPGHNFEEIEAPDLTTYDPVSLHKILQKLSLKNVQCTAIEATSHGLLQRRLDGIRFSSTALTNITQDHLDYHKTMEAYVSAKMRLFSDLIENNGTAILNQHSHFFEAFYRVCKKKNLNILKYGHEENADIAIYNEHLKKNEIIFDLRIYNKIFKNIVFKNLGAFQLENLMCALGLILGSYPHLNIENIISSIPYIGQIPGRMELVAYYKGARVFVDFCHTPDALKKVLWDLKRLSHKSLIVILGCGGNRDREKRSKMGKIAEVIADRVIITDDNPRFEDPAIIRAEIRQGMNKYDEIPGRDEAIKQAIADLDKDDILLIAGRGHESFQKIRGEKIPFNDKNFVQEIINKEQKYG